MGASDTWLLRAERRSGFPHAGGFVHALLRAPSAAAIPLHAGVHSQCAWAVRRSPADFRPHGTLGCHESGGTARPASRRGTRGCSESGHDDHRVSWSDSLLAGVLRLEIRRSYGTSGPSPQGCPSSATLPAPLLSTVPACSGCTGNSAFAMEAGAGPPVRGGASAEAFLSGRVGLSIPRGGCVWGRPVNEVVGYGGPTGGGAPQRFGVRARPSTSNSLTQVLPARPGHDGGHRGRLPTRGGSDSIGLWPLTRQSGNPYVGCSQVVDERVLSRSAPSVGPDTSEQDQCLDASDVSSSTSIGSPGAGVLRSIRLPAGALPSRLPRERGCFPEQHDHAREPGPTPRAQGVVRLRSTTRCGATGRHQVAHRR